MISSGFLRNAIPLHLRHLQQRAQQSGDWEGAVLDRAGLQRLLLARIASLDVAQAKADVRPFVRDAQVLAIWSPGYFRELAERVVCA